ncbi:MAG: gliding motility-associated C-terminal domain-containing protein [Candidatus Cloacimonetes bacterium]|nr:gliding motility-associated C-terminal domain-containing protein [Candidatus Cloacimonadota bacterium]
MLKRIILLIFVIISLFSFSILFADTIIVDTTGAGDYTTIQEGINASTNGDTVLVYPSTYYENINYNGKNITIGSLYLTTHNSDYIDSTIIDGNQNGSVVTFESGEDTTAVLCGFTIQNGSGTHDLGNIRGGGIFIINANPSITSCIITNNIAELGGGIHCRYSNISLKNTTIYFNHAFYHGGGIYLRDDSIINFSSINRCNIYNNYSAKGCDFCSYEVLASDIIVDTFTVLEPDEYFIQTKPENNFTLDILNGWIEPVNQDLYVSPNGDNANSGLNENEPLKSISWALTKIAVDTTNPNTIYLANGVYSPSLTNEMFPLNCRSYISIIGEGEENTILDGEFLSCIIWCMFGDNHFSIENMTIQHGNYDHGSAIKIGYNSSPVFNNITIKESDPTCDRAVYCYENSNPLFENVTIKDNIIGMTPVYCVDSDPIFLNCIIQNNSTSSDGGASGGITFAYCNPIIVNCLITDNEANDWIWGKGGGLWIGDAEIINVTVSDNYASISGGGIYSSRNTSITNSIVYNNSNDQIGTYPNAELTISYSDIQDGEAGISGSGTINWLEGNIDSLPQFVGGDPFSYQLQPSSPCIDKGTPDTTGLNLPPTDLAGNPRIFNGRIDIGAYECQDTISINEPDTAFIHNLYLFQNTPNPFTNETEILFITADYERVEDYSLSIYNTKGQLVRRFDGNTHDFWVKTKIVWDGTDEQGRQVAPGTYLYKLEYNGNAVVRKMVRLR